MTDHIAAVRAQAKRESELASSQRIKDSIQEWRNAVGANDDAWSDDWELEFWHAGYKHGAYSVIEWLASRLTREKIATVLDIKGAQIGDCGHEPGDAMECGNGCWNLLLDYADSILTLIIEDKD